MIIFRMYRAARSLMPIPPNCRFLPTCSIYAEEAIQKYGPFRGTLLAVRRLLKCHPGHPGGLDPVS